VQRALDGRPPRSKISGVKSQSRDHFFLDLADEPPRLPPEAPLPPAHDWRTTDQDEINRRRQRAREDRPRIENRTPRHPVFSNFQVHSPSGFAYEVEIRDLARRQFACTCVDFRINGLGTCKHIESVLLQLGEKFPAEFAEAKARGSARIDVVPDLTRQTLRVERGLDRLPPRLRARFDADSLLRGDTAESARVTAELLQEPLPALRISQDIAPWLDGRRRNQERTRLRRDYEQKVQSGQHPLSETSVPLFPYQREGMLHLAFTERALLADEMGLGKTIQAIAASALLHRLGSARRVLVVTPASLKAEWEEQIRRFTPLPCAMVYGPRCERLAAYAHATAPFFTLVNYEQVRTDGLEINTRLRPDIVILDEAQRIKTWNSLTAQSVKRLRSRHAFVLTGTPIENRIDELYSIIDFLDPTVLGPLFRFNREFYSFDERGRPAAYRNLDKLRATIRPLMLRRLKADVENELPSRHDRNLFVPLSDSQRAVYVAHEEQVARLAAIAQRRALLPREQEKLLRELAMLRMVCDTPYILSQDDADRADCPKLRELDAVLASALAEPGVKVIIFSEWVRMLDLVSELLDRRKIGYAIHTGAVPQKRRRLEINRFKEAPDCRVLLCSESGGVGLNLQVASVVINCDLPWNPAKYEQRIARAWRKHQSRPVTVINLIAENTIEHRMLETLAIKQGLAEGVLDGRGDLTKIPLRGGGALMARLRQIITPLPARPTPPVDPARAFAQRAQTFLDERLVACEERFSGDGSQSLLVVVVDRDAPAVREKLATWHEELFPPTSVPAAGSLQASERKSNAGLEVVDRQTAELLQRLETRGFLQRTHRGTRVLFPVEATSQPLDDAQQAAVEAQQGAALRKLKLTRLLASNGKEFAEEAAAAFRAALVAASATFALRHAMPMPQEEDGPLPPWLVSFYGSAAPAIQGFLAQPTTPLVPAIDALERALGPKPGEPR